MTLLKFELHDRQALAFNSIKATEILYGGSAGSGKSHLARVSAISWAVEIPGIQIYLFRRLYADLQLNHLEGPTGFRAMLAPWCNARNPQSPLIAGRLCEIVDGEIRFWNSSKIHLCHLQHQKDVTKYYGPEFHVLMLEEATQFTEYMIRFLRSRLRIPKSLPIPEKYLKPKEEWSGTDPEYYFPRALYTSNPGGIGHAYVKRMFVEGFTPGKIHKAPKEDGGFSRLYVPAKVDDNPSINREQVKSGLAGLPPALVDAMLNGNWNAVVGAFYPEINPAIHVVPPFLIPDHWPRFMAMDWGACGEGDPFSIGWWTVSDGTYLPRGSLICYRRWYGRGLPKVSVGQICAGIKERELGEKIVQRVAGGDILEKRGNGPSVFEIFSNEGIHFQRADMRRATGWIQIRERLIGKNGNPLIYWTQDTDDDLELLANVQHDLNDPSDVAAGDDHCLSGDTEILTSNGARKIKDLVGTTGHVLNHLGHWTPYKNCKSYGRQELVRLQFADGAILDCTPDHLLMNSAGEWIPAFLFADQVRYSRKWTQKLLPQPVKNSTALDTTSLATIIAEHRSIGADLARYIALSGSFIAARFRQIMRFTTSTTTEKITASQTCSACMSGSMANITAINPKRLSGLKNTLRSLAYMLPNGTAAKLGENGTDKTVVSCSVCRCATLPARIAAQPLSLSRLIPRFVAIIVNRLGEGKLGLMTSKKSAQSVPTLSPHLSIQRLRLAGRLAALKCLKIHVLPKAEVYCLDTPKPHSFYTATGIVVHNCADQIRYMCQSRPFARKAPEPEQPLYRNPTIDDLWKIRDQQTQGRR